MNIWQSFAQGLFLILAILALSSLSLNVQAAGGEKSNVTQRANSPITNPNPGTDLWRMVRKADKGITQVHSVDSGVLINSAGQDWRVLRQQKLIKYFSWVLLATILIIIAFYLIHGQIKVEEGFSGQKIKRWSVFERTVHWFTAICFVIMAISGLTIVLGRTLLIPIVGMEAFSYWAALMKLLHNYIGPFFSIGVLLVILTWISRALPSKDDIGWLASGGGIIGHAHPSAGALNAGEKGWFWVIATVGVVCSITGFILDFANFGQSREGMQLANIVHSITSVVWIVVAMGHIYIGSIGMEGSFEGMATGEVDVNWAKQHHDLWYDQAASQTGERSTTGVSMDKQRQPT